MISYTSRTDKGDKEYTIKFKTDNYEEFKKIEEEIRKLIDKRNTLRLLTEKIDSKENNDNKAHISIGSNDAILLTKQYDINGNEVGK